MNTLDFFTIANSICPDREMLIYQGGRWSFAQAGERINRLTHALIRLGVKKGDRVAMLQVNCNQYIEAYFAAAKIGAIFVPSLPLNPNIFTGRSAMLLQNSAE